MPPRKPTADPERENPTQAKAPNPYGADPEVHHETVAKAPMPVRKRGVVPQSIASDAAYSTGQDYDAVAGDEGGPMGSLDGEGLDALEPDELVPKTRALQALPDEAGAEAEGEGDDDNATRAGPPRKLHIIEGPDKGKKVRFKGVRMVIGRTPGVELQLSDQSVSRRHVELIASETGVTLQDLGSGNGTRVNGDKVAEKVLVHGDEIFIGKTKITFVDESEAFKKLRDEAEKEKEKGASAAGEEDEPKASGLAVDGKERKPVRTGRGEAPPSLSERFFAIPKHIRLAVLGSIGLVFFFFVVYLATRPPPPAPIDINKVQADLRMQEARTAVREGRYEEAVAFIDSAEKLSPGIDKGKLANKAREELSVARGLNEVKASIEKNRFEEARSTLQKLDKGSVKSQELRLKIEADLAAKEIIYRKARVEELLASGELEDAKALLAQLPPDAQADPAAKIAEFEKQLETQKKEDVVAARAGAAASAASKKQKRTEEMLLAFAVVERKFAGGEWDRAASECVRVVDSNSGDKEIVDRARVLQNLIPSFGRSYDEGVKKFKANQLIYAAKPLRLAWSTYGRMGLTANAYGRDLEEKLAQASVAAGKEALLRNDLGTAAVNFRDAVRLDPSDARAKQGLDEVSGRADELYQEGYVLKDRDPTEALKRFKVVLDVTPSGSATHEKAKNQIAAMSP